MCKSVLEVLLPGTRRRILATVLLEPEREWYMTDLAHRLGLTVSSMQKEVKLLSEAGILTLRRDGNRVYYSANQNCPLFPELRALFAKGATPQT